MLKPHRFLVFLSLLMTMPLLADQKVVDAIKDMTERANQGDVESQSLLGDVYLRGLKVDVDYDRALHWYRMAAESDDGDAQAAIAYMYDYGLGVEESVVTAVEWYKKAVENGSTMAMNNLGSMYLKGRGAIRSTSKALALYRQASDLNEPAALNQMGIFYREGELVEQDLEQARDYLLKSAKSGYEAGQHNLAVMLINGEGGDIDAVEAFAWFSVSETFEGRQKIENQVMPILREHELVDAANIRAIEYRALYTERPTVDM